MLVVRRGLAPAPRTRLFGRTLVAIRPTTSGRDSPSREDLQSLREELTVLQQLIREQQSQSCHIESLARTVSAQNAQLEQRLSSIESHVSRIGAMEQLASRVRDLLQNNPALRAVVGNLESVTPLLSQYKYAFLATLATIAVAWRYRAFIFYQSASEEVADLARLTLEQDSLRRSIQETLQTVVNNPSTLRTLNELVERLIANEQTQKDLVHLVVYATTTPEVQKALLDLLQTVFRDPVLQQLTGEFLLKGLDAETVRQMLDAQTAELVRRTVLDDAVQKATAAGVQGALWYTITPPVLWRFFPGGKKEDNTNSARAEAKDEVPSASQSEEHEGEKTELRNLPTQ